MAKRPLLVTAEWDDEAKVWVATSEDVPGLVTEAIRTMARRQLVSFAPRMRLLIDTLRECLVWKTRSINSKRRKRSTPSWKP